MAEYNMVTMSQNIAKKVMQELRDNGLFVSKWISVSEKLPEENVWVLVTVEQSGKRYQEIMRRYKYREAWTDNIDYYTDEITAWMPLPEPYTAESEEQI